MESGKKKDFLSLEFGNGSLNALSFQKRLSSYREFVNEVGALIADKGKSIDQSVLERHRKKGFNISSLDRLGSRARYFTDSGVIGSRQYVQSIYDQFSDHFDHKTKRKPTPIRGMDGIYSLKRLVLDID